MPPKRLTEDPQHADSSSDGEYESDSEETEEGKEENDGVPDKSGDEEEIEEDDEEEEKKNTSSDKKPSLKAGEKSSEKDDESESESESEPDFQSTQASPTASAFTIKPIVSDPVDDSSSKVKMSDSSIQTRKARSKRHAESDSNEKQSKRKKISNGEDEEGKRGSSGYLRLWSEDDEIAILKGMTDYQTVKGSDPYEDMSAFHEFIKKNLHVEASKNQLIDKIRRLKKKYQLNVEKGEMNGGDEPVFSRYHEQKSFELSKKVWGALAKRKQPSKSSSRVNNITSLSSPKRSSDSAGKKEESNVDVDVDDDKLRSEEFLASYPWLSASFQLEENRIWPNSVMHLVKEGITAIGSSTAKELDERWRKLSLSKLECYLNKVDLIKEQTKLILDSMRSD